MGAPEALELDEVIDIARRHGYEDAMQGKQLGVEGPSCAGAESPADERRSVPKSHAHRQVGARQDS